MEAPVPHLSEFAVRVAAGEVIRSPALGPEVFARECLGLVIDEVSWTRVTGHLVAGPEHWQAAGIVHGGVWSAVVETLASWGAAVQAAVDGRRVVGVSNTTSFLRPHRRGRVDAVARPVDTEGFQPLWEVVISRPEGGKHLAVGMVRLHVLEEAET